jgi:hypothetical protein
MSRAFTGHITHIGEKQTGTKAQGGTWQSQEIVVVDESGQYPETGVFKFVGQNVSKIERFKVGQPVTVQYNLKGREYKGKWYMELTGWDIKNPVADDIKRDEPLNGDMANEFNKSQNDDDSDLPF